MKQLLIGKSGTLKYASSKSDATVATATSPDLLADGAIGVYVTTPTSLIPVLVTAGNVASYTGNRKNKIVIAMGTSTGAGAIISESITLEEISRVFAKENEIARKSVSFIGYDGLTGTLNLGTFGLRDTGIVSFLGKKTSTFGGTVQSGLTGVQEYQATYDSGRLNSGATAYDIVSQLVTTINADTNNGFATVDVTANGTFGVITGTGSMVFTKGNNTITTTTHNVLAGDYVSINNTPYSGVAPSIVLANNITVPTTGATGIVYKVVSVTTTNIVLDRPYTGETQTITAGNVVSIWIGKTTTIPTQFGLRLLSGSPYQQLSVSVGGVIQYATIEYLSGIFTGSGTTSDMTKLERDSNISMGFMNTADAHLPRPVTRVDTTKVYDKYNIDVAYKAIPSFPAGNRATDSWFSVVTFESGSNDTVGFNQKDFNTIITALYTTIITDIILTA